MATFRQQVHAQMSGSDEIAQTWKGPGLCRGMGWRVIHTRAWLHAPVENIVCRAGRILRFNDERSV